MRDKNNDIIKSLQAQVKGLENTNKELARRNEQLENQHAAKVEQLEDEIEQLREANERLGVPIKVHEYIFFKHESTKEELIVERELTNNYYKLYNILAERFEYERERTNNFTEAPKE